MTGDPFELSLEIARSLPAIVGILLEAPRDDVVEDRRCQRLQRCHRRRLVIENCADETRLTLAFERAAARQHLVEHAAEGEDVGASIDFLSFELLWGHVLQRSENRALH